MIFTSSTARRWGNSIGITIPRDIVDSFGIDEGDEVSLFVVKKENPLKKWVGRLKSVKTTDQMLKEIDKDLYND